MPAKTVRPYGTWPSPVTPDLVARGSRRFGMVQHDGNAVYWSEARPEQGGRQTLMRALAGRRPEELLAAPHSARSRVHEYGGGEFLVAHGTVYFVNDIKQQQDIYALTPGHPPRRITRQPTLRFADFALDAARTRLIAVAEEHRGEGHPRNLLVAVGLRGRERGRVTEIAGGHDFYATPRLSPDGTRLAFLAWDLPDMPWDSATLYLAAVTADGTPGRPKRIAGGDGSAIFQPEWIAQTGILTFVSDETGWGALYQLRDGQISCIHAATRGDLFRAQWQFGMRSYAINPLGTAFSVFLEDGRPLLKTEQLFPIAPGRPQTRRDLLQQGVSRIDSPTTAGGSVHALLGTATHAPAIVDIMPDRLIPRMGAQKPVIPEALVSAGEVRRFRSGRHTVFGIYYAPHSDAWRGPRGRLPPALVLAHGGPTSMADATLSPRVQYYTSRGFAVLDVNYAGSTGYGRAYRQRLDGQWGIADVADCAAAARHLAEAGLADPDRIVISGGSAGGYTTLMALATTKAFAAGSSHYGISDLALLLAHTHKFEAGYLHRLMGTTPRNWQRTFAERSPLALIEGITAPVILFQGLDDRVVPPEQSRLIVDKLRTRGIEVDYREFAGEGHGFRRAETIIAVLEAELAFLQRVLRLG